MLLVLVGVAGWESARRLPGVGATQTVVQTARQVAGAQTIRVESELGRRVVWRMRTIAAPGRTSTVVLTRRVTQIVPTLAQSRLRTITAQRTRTVVPRATTRTVGETQTIRETVTATVQAGGHEQPPPGQVGRTRTTQTVTVTQVETRTVTQPPVTATVTTTVTTTTSKGH